MEVEESLKNLHVTVVAMVALVALVGITAIVLNGKAGTLPSDTSVFVEAEPQSTATVEPVASEPVATGETPASLTGNVIFIPPPPPPPMAG